MAANSVFHQAIPAGALRLWGEGLYGPWVDPSTGTASTLPAKVRFDSMTHQEALADRETFLRVFPEDVLLCPCGGRRVVLAFVAEKKLVKEILEHLGLPTPKRTFVQLSCLARRTGSRMRATPA